MRGATLGATVKHCVARFLLTRPMRGATVTRTTTSILLIISTHTPHAGRDGKQQQEKDEQNNFYSHAPCGARLTWAKDKNTKPTISTHTPHAGRDAAGLGKLITVPDFYSHAPCGARLGSTYTLNANMNFYSHAPCGARLPGGRLPGDPRISTHTPHAGRDVFFFFQSDLLGISTHTPHAGRDHGNEYRRARPFQFLLTRPMRGATYAGRSKGAAR